MSGVQLYYIPESGRRAAAVATSGAKDVTGLMNQLGADMLRSVHANFKAQGWPFPWVPSRHAMESGKKTLMDRLLLLNSIKRRHNADSAGVYTRWIYAAIHEFGGTIYPKKGKYLTFPVGRKVKGKQPFVRVKSVRIIARPYMRPPKEDMDAIEAKAAEWIRGSGTLPK